MKIEYRNQAIDLDKLTCSRINVRTVGRSKKIDALAASIAAQGLVQPLTVYKTEKGYEVDAGARRLAALRLLADRGEWSDKVQCRVIPSDLTEKERRAISFAENEGQLPMHPLDRMRVLVGMVTKGETVEAVAMRFGISDQEVSDTLKLQKLALPLRVALGEGKLSLSQALAYLRAGDQAAQVEAFETYGIRPAAQIVSCLRHTHRKHGIAMTENNRLFKFVAEAYEDAGHGFETDLFVPEGQRRVDGAAVMSLVRGSLAAHAEDVKAEEGADWVETCEYETPNLDGLRRWYSADCPVSVGFIVHVDWRGECAVTGPVVREAEFRAWEDKMRAEALAAEDSEDEDTPETDAAEVPEEQDAEPMPDPETLSRAPSRPMMADAAHSLTGALRAHVSADPGQAYDLLLSALLGACSHISTKSDVLRINGYIPEHPALAAMFEEIGSDDMIAENIVAKLDADTKARLLAALVAGMVDTSKKDYMGHPDSTPRKGAAEVCTSFGVNMHEDWQEDDRRAYLDRMTKRDLGAVVLGLNDADLAEAMANNDKSAMVERAMDAHWLPEFFAGADGAQEVEDDDDTALAMAAE